MFQTCQPLDGAPQYQCENFTQYNTFLGGHKCEETFYEPIQVFEHVYFLPDRTAVQERRECIGSQNCTIVPFLVTFKDAVMVKLYWCRLKPHIYLPSKKGAMFGGIFMDGEINDITGKYGCPGTFKPYRIGKSVTACLSYNYAQDFIYSVPIEGFFSCQTSDKTCLNGFTQHHAATENHCDLYYCVKDSQNSFNRIFRRFVNFFTKSFSK
uniref:Uncharacterized protein n=1 Tax=Panagrolaimus davidi TaxID=227884 RepID=A0A914PXF7_9BILA